MPSIFVDARVIMQVIVDAVAPAIAPAVGGETVLSEHRGRVRGIVERDRAL